MQTRYEDAQEKVKARVRALNQNIDEVRKSWVGCL